MYSGRLVLRDSHCLAPPLQSTFRPSRLSREAEAVLQPRAPLRPTKQEVRESETSSSVEFILDDAEDVKVKVEAPAKIAEDPPPAVRHPGRAAGPDGLLVVQRGSGPLGSGLPHAGPPPHPVGPAGPSRATRRSRPTQGVQEQAARRTDVRDIRAARAGRSRRGPSQDDAAEEIG